MTSRLTHSLLAIAALVVAAASPATFAQTGRGSDLEMRVGQLSSLDYATRTSAARMIRRANAADAVAALSDAVRRNPDEFVRYRALILLTAFEDRGTPALMRTLLSDRNDRIREVAYRWFERHPDPELANTLIAALDTEQAEFVRPALIRTLAALPPDDRIRRAMTAEISRGFDFFRSAVIDALGAYHGDYAVDALMPIAGMDGPLQDDAVLALGRIGGARAAAAIAAIKPTEDAAPAVQAAQCLAGGDCGGPVMWLTERVRTGTRAEVSRSALGGLRVLAAQDKTGAIAALLDVSGSMSGGRRDEVAAAFSGAALERPDTLFNWITTAREADRAVALEMLHDGFELLEEDFAEEQFYAAVRAAYWAAPEGSPRRTVAATIIDKLEF